MPSMNSEMTYLRDEAVKRAREKDSTVNVMMLMFESGSDTNYARHFLRIIRLMQLDMRGETDPCVASLGLDPKALAKLIRSTKDGVGAFPKVAPIKGDKCTICGNEKLGDEKPNTVMPCAKQHRGHYNCVWRWLNRDGHKRCKECLEYIF